MKESSSWFRRIHSSGIPINTVRAVNLHPRRPCHGLGPPSPWQGGNESWSIISYYCARESFSLISSLAKINLHHVCRLSGRDARYICIFQAAHAWVCPFAHPSLSTGPRPPPSSCQPKQMTTTNSIGRMRRNGTSFYAWSSWKLDEKVRRPKGRAERGWARRGLSSLWCRHAVMNDDRLSIPIGTRGNSLLSNQRSRSAWSSSSHLLPTKQQKLQQRKRQGREIYSRVETIGVAVEDDVDATAAGGGDDRVLVAEIDAYDGHGCWFVGGVALRARRTSHECETEK